VTGGAAASLDFLAIPFSETAPLTSLKGIECFTGLTRLDIGGPDIPSLGSVDLTPVASITGLTTFDIHRDEYDADAGYASAPRTVFLDLTPLAYHPALKGVRLEINAVKDITALGTLSLSVLTVGSQFVTDISPIGKLTGLGRVLLRGKGITDLSPLASVLPTWKGGIQITDTSAIDISSLAGFTGVSGLGLDHNLIADISPLAGLTQLTSLTVTGNPIDCATQRVHLQALEAAGVRLKHDCP
jgi:internalin A